MSVCANHYYLTAFWIVSKKKKLFMREKLVTTKIEIKKSYTF